MNTSGSIWRLLPIIAFANSWLHCGQGFGQGGYNDDRVMIQGFMWESH